MPENEVFSNLNHMLQEIKELNPDQQQEVIGYMKEMATPRIFEVFYSCYRTSRDRSEKLNGTIFLAGQNFYR